MSDQTLGNLVDRTPADIEPGQLLSDAAAEMTNNAIGSLLVVGATGLVGVLTERDIVRAVAEGNDPKHERIDDWMTSQLLTAGTDETVAVALEKLKANEVRHIVVTENDQPIGIISQRALVAAL